MKRGEKMSSQLENNDNVLTEDAKFNIKESKKIINNIKSDLSNHYYNISAKELMILSHNIYDYSYLMANNIEQEVLVSHFINCNMEYYNELSEEEKKHMLIEHNIKFYKYLIEKYTEIIKSNKKS